MSSSPLWSGVIIAVVSAGLTLIGTLVAQRISGPNVVIVPPGQLDASPTPAICESNHPSQRVVDQLTMSIWVRKLGEQCWHSSLADLKPGDSVEVELAIFNDSPGVVDDVSIQGWIPEALGFRLVPGSTLLANSRNPKGAKVSDHILDPGINIGSYANGGNAYLKFTVELPNNPAAACGLQSYGIGGQIFFPHEYSTKGWQVVGIMTNLPC